MSACVVRVFALWLLFWIGVFVAGNVECLWCRSRVASAEVALERSLMRECSQGRVSWR